MLNSSNYFWFSSVAFFKAPYDLDYSSFSFKIYKERSFCFYSFSFILDFNSYSSSVSFFIFWIFKDAVLIFSGILDWKTLIYFFCTIGSGLISKISEYIYEYISDYIWFDISGTYF